MDDQSDISARMLLGARLRELRKAQGLSLRKLALMIGVSYPYLDNIENGKQAATVDVLDKIARGLGVRIRDLF